MNQITVPIEHWKLLSEFTTKSHRSSYALSAIHYHDKKLVALDGTRLLIITLDNGPLNIAVNLPLFKVPGRKSEKISISWTEKEATLKTGPITLITPLVEGQFPNYFTFIKPGPSVKIDAIRINFNLLPKKPTPTT